MCTYCEKSNNSNLPIGSLDVSIEGKILKLRYDAYSTDSSFSEEVEIKFCPMCGERLREFAVLQLEEHERQKKEMLIFDMFDRRNIYCNKYNEGFWVKAGDKHEAKEKLNCFLKDIKCLYTYRDLELRDMTEKNHSA